jgi:Dehydrogenases with different specificities (related to short-chain alcohol dehydrogenases)
MVQRGKGGAIISIASTAAFVGIPGRGPYCAAKAGIMGLTRALCPGGRFGGHRVNAIAPGYTRTKLVEDGIKNGSLKEEWMLERVPMGRLAKPEEIAGIACFLASDAAAYITGQVITADGGWTIQGQGRAPGWLTTGQSAE